MPRTVETNPISQAYQVQQQVIASLRELRGDTPFTNLQYEDRLQYCETNKQIMESYWRCFEIARDNGLYDDAIQDFRQAFDMGFDKARRLFTPQTTSQSTATTELSYDNQAENNLNIGLRYQLGLGVVQNDHIAFKFIMQAAKQGLAEAQHFLGLCFSSGLGVDVDKGKALEWHQRAAYQDYTKALHSVGRALLFGEGVDPNDAKAFECAQTAAEQGFVYSINMMGYCYQYAKGVEVNKEKAIEWYKLAIAQGSALAHTNMGYCFQVGDGVDKDEQKAVEWYEAAAKLGDRLAIENLEELGTPLAMETLERLNRPTPPSLQDLGFFGRDIDKAGRVEVPHVADLLNHKA